MKQNYSKKIEKINLKIFRLVTWEQKDNTCLKIMDWTINTVHLMKLFCAKRNILVGAKGCKGLR